MNSHIDFDHNNYLLEIFAECLPITLFVCRYRYSYPSANICDSFAFEINLFSAVLKTIHLFFRYFAGGFIKM